MWWNLQWSTLVKKWWPFQTFPYQRYSIIWKQFPRNIILSKFPYNHFFHVATIYWNVYINMLVCNPSTSNETFSFFQFDCLLFVTQQWLATIDHLLHNRNTKNRYIPWNGLWHVNTVYSDLTNFRID